LFRKNSIGWKELQRVLPFKHAKLRSRVWGFQALTDSPTNWYPIEHTYHIHPFSLSLSLFSIDINSRLICWMCYWLTDFLFSQVVSASMLFVFHGDLRNAIYGFTSTSAHSQFEMKKQENIPNFQSIIFFKLSNRINNQNVWSFDGAVERQNSINIPFKVQKIESFVMSQCGSQRAISLVYVSHPFTHSLSLSLNLSSSHSLIL
jgi:hypothetical protein